MNLTKNSWYQQVTNGNYLKISYHLITSFLIDIWIGGPVLNKFEKEGIKKLL